MAPWLFFGARERREARNAASPGANSSVATGQRSDPIKIREGQGAFVAETLTVTRTAGSRDARTKLDCYSPRIELADKAAIPGVRRTDYRECSRGDGCDRRGLRSRDYSCPAALLGFSSSYGAGNATTALPGWVGDLSQGVKSLLLPS